MSIFVNSETSSMKFSFSVPDHRKEYEVSIHKTPKKKFGNVQGCWWVEVTTKYSQSGYILNCYFHLKVNDKAIKCGMQVDPEVTYGGFTYPDLYMRAVDSDGRETPVQAVNLKNVYKFSLLAIPPKSIDMPAKITLKFKKMLESVPKSHNHKEIEEHWMMTKPFSMMYNEEYFKDFTFIVDNKEFKVHKCILAGSSEVLRTMLMSEFEESKSNSTNITDIEPEVFQVLIDFIYGNKAEFNRNFNSFTYSVYAAAHKYQMKILQDFCAEYIYENCTGLELAIETYTFASFYNLKELQAKCWEVIVSEILEDETLQPPQEKDLGTFFKELQHYQDETGKIKSQIKQKMLKRL